MGDGRVLDDVRVVDLTEGYGGFAGRLLVELGADVVRVEDEGGRREWPRAVDGTSLHHLIRNAGKTLVDVDGAGLDGLLEGADLALVSSATPADLADARTLHVAHPHLIVVSLTPFGLESPCADWVSTELVTQSLSGIVHSSGVPELPPLSAPGHHSEDMGAVHAVLAGLLALRQRMLDGQGRLVDVAAVLAQAQATDMSVPLWSLLHMARGRQGAGTYPLFECLDGTVRIVLPMSPKEWRDLIAWLGSPPEWVGGGWDEPMLGPDEREIIVAAIERRCASSSRDEIESTAGAAGVRITSVLSPAEVLTNEHTAARRTFAPMTLDDGSIASVFAGVFSVDGERAAVDRPMVRGVVPSWTPRDRSINASGDHPLTGIRVIEIGTGVAAPEGARLFADWGADVIKIEHRSRPDFQRMVMGGAMNPAFSTVARNKRVFGVDLSTEEGRRLLLRLIATADVVMENNATGVLDRLGIGWDALRAANPSLVLVDTQMLGDRGPWSHRKGYGPSARAIGGLTWMWAHGPDAPRGVMSIHPDHLGGRLCAIAALAGLSARDRDGRGRRLDMAQFEAVGALLAEQFALESLQPGAAVPTGNIHPDHAPWNLFRCTDTELGESWLAVCARDDGDWGRLVDVAGGAIEDRPAWSTESGRVADRGAVDTAVGDWCASLDAAELEARLQAAGVPAGRVLSASMVIEHPVFTGRGYPVEVDQPGCGPLLLEGSAFVLSGGPSPRTGRAPLLGEHTEEIARTILGLDPAEILALQGIGVLDGPESAD